MTQNTIVLADPRRILRVLVVETSPTDGRLVWDALQQRNEFLPTIARSLQEAETLLSGVDYDVALIAYRLWTDHDAPLGRLIRERRPDLAVVLLMDGPDDREALPALKLGAHDFVSKGQLGDASQLALRIIGAYEESRSLRRRDTMVRWLEREARTDHLTGLYNRRLFDERLREASEVARRAGSPTTLIVADLADTRSVNEAHGHEIGDDMIRRAARGIARCVRGSDFAARIGGDDFGIILEAADLDLGKLIARRIAQEIERLNTNEWQQLLPVTLSFGVATGRNCQAGELFAAADQALTANRFRRPQVTLFSPRIDSDGPSVA